MEPPITKYGCRRGNIASAAAVGLRHVWGSSAQIDPPPTDIETQMLEGLDAVEQTSFAQEEALSTVYLVNEHGLLAPVALHLPDGEASLKLNRMLEMLVKDGKYASLLPAGFSGILPAGSEVKAVTVKKTRSWPSSSLIKRLPAMKRPMSAKSLRR